MIRSSPAPVALAAALVVCAQVGEAQTPHVSIEERVPARIGTSIAVEGGYDGNVRLLAPVELVPGVPVADGFVGVTGSVTRDEAGDGVVVSADLGVRKFIDPANGVSGAGSFRAGWRGEAGRFLLEPAVDVSAFAWSVFPSDRHVAAAFAPLIVAERRGVSLTIAPSVLARVFNNGTDKEAWLRASGAWRLGIVELRAGYLGGAVASAAANLSRTLHRVDVGATVRPSTRVSFGARTSWAVKQLPDYPSAHEGGVVGRTDRILGGRLWARGWLTDTLAILAEADGLLSRSVLDVADYDRISATGSLEWSWERPASRRARAGGRRDVRFRVTAPGANVVALAGAFTEWTPQQMRAEGDGTFVLDIPLEPGEHHFGLLVDGVFALPDGVPHSDDGFGGCDAVVFIGG